MTTALAFDLFLDEHEAIMNNELFTNINNSAVVKNNNSEIKIKKGKGSFFRNQNVSVIKVENENPKKEIFNSKGSFFENQNLNIQSEESENEILDLEKVRKDMIKGYMKMMSQF